MGENWEGNSSTLWEFNLSVADGLYLPADKQCVATPIKPSRNTIGPARSAGITAGIPDGQRTNRHMVVTSGFAKPLPLALGYGQWRPNTGLRPLERQLEPGVCRWPEAFPGANVTCTRKLTFHLDAWSVTWVTAVSSPTIHHGLLHDCTTNFQRARNGPREPGGPSGGVQHANYESTSKPLRLL